MALRLVFRQNYVGERLGLKLPARGTAQLGEAEQHLQLAPLLEQRLRLQLHIQGCGAIELGVDQNPGRVHATRDLLPAGDASASDCWLGEVRGVRGVRGWRTSAFGTLFGSLGSFSIREAYAEYERTEPVLLRAAQSSEAPELATAPELASALELGAPSLISLRSSGRQLQTWLRVAVVCSRGGQMNIEEAGRNLSTETSPQGPRADYARPSQQEEHINAPRRCAPRGGLAMLTGHLLGVHGSTSRATARPQLSACVRSRRHAACACQL